MRRPEGAGTAELRNAKVEVAGRDGALRGDVSAANPREREADQDGRIPTVVLEPIHRHVKRVRADRQVRIVEESSRQAKALRRYVEDTPTAETHVSRLREGKSLDVFAVRVRGVLQEPDESVDTLDVLHHLIAAEAHPGRIGE